MAELNENKEVGKEVAAKPKAPKKPGFFKRIGKFFREAFSEMKKVTWLSSKETVKSSIIVVVVTVALCAVIGLLDTVLELGVIGLRDLSGALGWK